MPDTPQDLLEAICLSPDDDALRERYAKLVEEADPPHAQLIRLQLERDQSERASNVVSSRYSGPEAGLIQEHGARWSRYIAKFLVPGSMPGSLGCTFVRGFIGQARIAIENVVGLGAQLYMFAPIQHLDVVAGEGDPRRLFSVPGLEHLDSISLQRLNLGDAGAQDLAECGALTRATYMDLGHNGFTNVGALALAGSAMMRNKVVVILDGNPCDPIEEAHFDYDGTLVEVSAKYAPEQLERVVGRRVEWMHYRWSSSARKPDRFHTRYAIG